jgi:CheY-like chemotaxis protein/anti-sigma regulatory factor (Ser/Thr protein kinase)
MNPQPTAESNPGQATPMFTVLVVDDSTMDRQLAGGIIRKLGGWNAAFANDGRDALAVMERELPDIVLTDLQMPEMDGLELVQEIRAKYPAVPVILMTAHGSEDIAIQALQKGAASYVPKKSLAHDLAETLDQLLNVAKTTRSQHRVLSALHFQEMRFVLENDTSLIPPLVSFLEETITKVQMAESGNMILLGVALHEALTNAIFHGNLELSSTLKEANEKEYYRQAEERKKREPFLERRVYVSVLLTPQEAMFVVRDDGNGFDPSALPDPTDPTHLERVHGRGLLLIHTFMDRVQHNPRGNEITMVKFRGKGKGK